MCEPAERARPADGSSIGYARPTMPAAAQLDHHLVCPDPDATSALGAALAGAARAGDVVCLWGDLGAGKTHLAKAFGAGLGVSDTITSPSFILMAEYTGRLPLFHIDLYRLSDAADALAGGLIDDRQGAGVTLVEWPDRLGPALPVRRLDVIIDGAGDEPRSVTLRATDPDLRRYLDTV
jgi:tRNA threonylcarbamoyladenosine biosynthesis protein TsaE